MRPVSTLLNGETMTRTACLPLASLTPPDVAALTQSLPVFRPEEQNAKNKHKH